MGAWGQELDANDSAQDVLEEFSKDIDFVRRQKGDVATLFRKVQRRYGADSDAILGLGWRLHKRNVALIPVRSLLLNHLKRESNPRRLQEWGDSEPRLYALKVFECLLLGQPIPPRPKHVVKRFPKRIAANVRGRWGYRDSTGKLVIKPQFDFADDFDGGVARVRVGFRPHRVRYGLINTAGQWILPLKYDEMDVFIRGVTKARHNGKNFYFNRQGIRAPAPT
jgi:hypothetical protein